MLPASMAELEHEAQLADEYSQREMRLRDEGAASYESNYSPYQNYVELERLRREARLGADTSVLDLGCGTGRLTRECLRAGVRVVGADLSLSALEQARASVKPGAGTHLGLVQADARALPLRAEAFDRVVACQVIGQIPEGAVRRQALAEAARVLKPGGLLVFNVHNFGVRERRIGQKHTGLSLDVDEPYFHYYTTDEVVGELPPQMRMLRTFGLRSLGRKGEALGVWGILVERTLERTFLSKHLGRYLVVVAQKTAA